MTTQIVKTIDWVEKIGGSTFFVKAEQQENGRWEFSDQESGELQWYPTKPDQRPRLLRRLSKEIKKRKTPKKP